MTPNNPSFVKLRTTFIALLVITLAVIMFFVGRGFKSERPLQKQDSNAQSNLMNNQVSGAHSQPALEYPARNDLYPNLKMRPWGALIRTRGQLPYEIAITLFAGKLKGITLSAEQIEQLQDVYSTVYQSRLSYEVSKARVGSIAEDQVLVEIPTYPEFGQKLKETTASMFQSILGQDLSNKVMEQIGDQIDASNLNWGVNTQTILAKYDAQSNSYKLTHTISTAPSTGQTVMIKETDAVYETAQMGEYGRFLPMFPKP